MDNNTTDELTMNKSKNTDKIFEDLLDDDFVNVFKPCFFLQRIFGTLGVNIEFKFITPPTKRYRGYCLVTWLANSLCVLHTVAACSTRFDSLSTDTPLKIGMVLNGVVYSMLVWKNMFFCGHARCQLYVKLQKIERSLKMKNAKRMNEKLHSVAWIMVVISLFLYTTYIGLSKYMLRGYCPTAWVTTMVSSTVYFEIYHVSTILYFISVRVQYINNKLRQGNMKLQKVFTFDYKTTDDRIGDELVCGMFNILDSFADTMDNFSHAMFAFTFQMLAWQLLSAQNLIVSLKNQMSVDVMSFLSTLPSSLICMSLMVTLCLISQSVTNKLDTCADICTTLTFSLKGRSRENAKRITHLLKGRRAGTVVDVFQLDTQLPLHLFGITASYTIVLLQIAAL